MTEFDEKKIFENRADTTGEYERMSCNKCFENLIFAMRDNEHEFSVGLLTVIECLRVAENEGAVPPLPSEWWSAVYTASKL